MKLLGHPLFLVFAFSLLVCLAGIWWLLRQPPERDDLEDRASAPREGERSVMEILQAVPLTISSAENAPAAPHAVTPDKMDATQQAISRAEAKTRLVIMDELIREQTSCIASARAQGLDVTLLEEQLKVLTDSRDEYFSALKRLLTDSWMDGT